MRQKPVEMKTDSEQGSNSPLSLRLLGSYELKKGDRRILNVGSRKAQALLAYVASTPIPSSRDTLAALLWPTMAEKSAKNNLRTTLASLKRHLGPYLDIDPASVVFNRQIPYFLDVEALRISLDTAVSAPNPEQLHEAVAHYKGEFLQGFHVRKAGPFEEWMLQQREEIHLLVLRALEVLTVSCIEQKSYVVGLSAGRQLLAMEPWSEVAHRQLMTLLAATGKRSQALQQYKSCRQMLAAEFGVEPSAETSDLYKQIQAETVDGFIAHRQSGQPANPVVIRTNPDGKHVLAPSIPNNLQVPLAAFVGRQTEVDFICQRLSSPDCRLLTIVGPGGIGKTSLAQAAGQRLLRSHSGIFPDGIFFVSLLGVATEESEERERAQNGEQIVGTIADSVGCDIQGGMSRTHQLQRFLRTRQLLLILDNFEHLLDATEEVVTLLNQAPHISIAITSRARLNVRGETILPLDKLSLPPAPHLVNDRDSEAGADYSNRYHLLEADSWEESEAVAMFVQRAQCHIPYFSISAENLGAVIEICCLVDGLPLGIELAASMLPMVNCIDLATELAEDLNFLETDLQDLPYEQRTLQSVFERSWRLLLPQEQSLLSKLSVFPSTFDRKAAQVIADASMPLLMRLANQSLLSRVDKDCYSMHRTIREFAQKKLQQQTGQQEIAQKEHALYYLTFLAQKEAGLMGREQGLTAKQISVEIDNVRAAWRWGVIHGMTAELLLSIRTFFLFHQQQGLFADAFDLFSYAVYHGSSGLGASNFATPDSQHALLLGRLHTYLGWSNASLGRMLEAEIVFQKGLSFLQKVEDLGAEVGHLTMWGAVIQESNLKQSEKLLQQALKVAYQAKDKVVNDNAKATTHLFLGKTMLLMGEYGAAERVTTDGYNLARQLNWSWGLANSQQILGSNQLCLGNYDSAEVYFRKCVELAHEQSQKVLLVESTLSLGDALRLQGRVDQAQDCCTIGRQLAEEYRFDLKLAQALWVQGCLAEQQKAYAEAKVFFDESLTIHHHTESNYILPTPGWVLLGLDKLDEAQHYFENVLAKAEAKHSLPTSLDAQVGLVYIHHILTNSGVKNRQKNTTDVEHGLKSVHEHPSTTQETRDRIVRITAELSVPLTDRRLVAA